MGIVDFRAEVGKRVDAAHYLKEPTIITKGAHEEPRAVLIPYDWYEGLEYMLRERGIELPPATTTRAED